MLYCIKTIQLIKYYLWFNIMQICICHGTVIRYNYCLVQIFEPLSIEFPSSVVEQHFVLFLSYLVYN